MVVSLYRRRVAATVIELAKDDPSLVKEVIARLRAAGEIEVDDLVSSWRIKTDSRTTADEMALTYRGLLADEQPITGIALCSTVPSVLREMRVMLDRYFVGVPTVIVEPGTKTGVPVLTDNPKEVGADRIVNTIAAHHLFGGPCIVVDFGTSTNLDVVSARREMAASGPQTYENTAAATGTPATMPPRRATRSRVARWSGGTVATVVTSTPPSRSSATARSMSDVRSSGSRPAAARRDLARTA